MNILFITHYSALYGANRSLLALLDGLSGSKIKPHVLISVSGDIEQELEKRNIDYTQVPFKNWMAPTRFKIPLRLIANILLLPYLYIIIKKLKIDLIHTNSSVTPVGAWLAFISGLPHIWHIREFGWDDYHYRYDLGRKQFEYWLNKADHLICVSKAIEKSVLKGIQTPRTVIYNGVISKDKAEKLRISQVSSTRNRLFGILGLLDSAKGQEDAIRAFSRIQKRYQNTELLIAGSGSDDYEEYLHDLVRELDINRNVQFLGYVKDPFKFYSKIDVALICSKNEGMGRVTAEAMVAGKVIIGLDNAGTSELIRDKATGLLYDGSISSLVSEMEYTLNNSCLRLAINAQNDGFNKFLIENYAQKIQVIIDSV